MIVLDHALVFCRGGKDDVTAVAHFVRRDARDEPAVADPAHPLGRCRGAAANPDRGRGLEEWLGRNADVMAGGKRALRRDAVPFPIPSPEAAWLIRSLAPVG